MSIHASIHVEKDMTAILNGPDRLVIFTGFGTVTFTREETPNVFDALVEIFDVRLPESVEAG